ncbi:MAG: FAD-dependent oxidoreductase [Gemmobacter sp.]
MADTPPATALPRRNGEVSFWQAALGGMAPARPPLGGDARVDVAIVGAGYTGLWTALYMKPASPGVRVGLIEAERAGFGASGRNGGWLSGDFAWKPERYLKNGSAEDVRRLIGALARTVPEVIARARPWDRRRHPRDAGGARRDEPRTACASGRRDGRARAMGRARDAGAPARCRRDGRAGRGRRT